MNVKIGGTEYPIAMTVEAQRRIAEKAGGLDKIKDVIGSEQLSNMAVLHILIEAGVRRKKVLAKMAGEEYVPPVIPDEEDIPDLMYFSESADVMKAMNAAFREGNKSEVEIKPEPKKKASATRSK